MICCCMIDGGGRGRTAAWQCCVHRGEYTGGCETRSSLFQSRILPSEYLSTTLTTLDFFCFRRNSIMLIFNNNYIFWHSQWLMRLSSRMPRRIRCRTYQPWTCTCSLVRWHSSWIVQFLIQAPNFVGLGASPLINFWYSAKLNFVILAREG